MPLGQNWLHKVGKIGSQRDHYMMASVLGAGVVASLMLGLRYLKRSHASA